MCTNYDFEISPGFVISKYNPCFLIAEIGQNHQGDIRIAKQLIDASQDAGANCVKFQKSCLSEKFNLQALNRPYTGEHSWGNTYGEHKKYLEFSLEDFKELQRYANSVGIIFSASAMDCSSVDVLDEMDVPFLKIGSGDANNFPLLEYAASKKRPLVISTGMQNIETVRAIYHLLKKLNAKFSLLHCVSSYPAPTEEINLEVLNLYKTNFPDIQIGYSGHEIGTTVSVAAVAMGARILERHITLDTSWKGSDHASSLTPSIFTKMVKKIRYLEVALGRPCKKRQPCEMDCYIKLGKTVVAAKPLKRDSILEKRDVRIKVAEPKGCPAEMLNCIVGKVLLRNINEDESIMENDLK